MDWAALMRRRNSKAPIDAGGWNIFHSWMGATSLLSPAANFNVRGQGSTGYFGRFKDPKIEKLTENWIAAETDATRQSVFDAIQLETWLMTPTITPGQCFPTRACRKKLIGRLSATNFLARNIREERDTYHDGSFDRQLH